MSQALAARWPILAAFLALSDRLRPETVLPRRRARGAARARHGSIALVGAGPGAADLLTLRAIERIRAADAIFYDRLIDPAVLRFARPGARLVHVGKAVGGNLWPQERINAEIVASALAGERVVRLKSGDPGIFGRAGEEIAAADAHGIPVEIVPGLTAASAACASLGRSLTERGAIDRLTLATATCRPGDPAPDFSAMLAPGTTLALYMAMHVLPEVQAGLLAAGATPETPVDIVSNASRADERRLSTTVGGLARDARAAGIGNPAILLVRRAKPAETVSVSADCMTA
ncbi:uroporphyrinogen-III C-methyltransferase [Rhodobacter sp. NSM]|uniref:uroporphyrinogen-III C-methyltransferase n=1 Tax=Rhodobacter sp. NSM TaxID=3457501 RepID=UPI003FD1B68B